MTTPASDKSKKGRKPVPSHRQIICRSIGMMAADWARAEALAERLDMSVTALARQAILTYIASNTESELVPVARTVPFQFNENSPSRPVRARGLKQQKGNACIPGLECL